MVLQHMLCMNYGGGYQHGYEHYDTAKVLSTMMPKIHGVVFQHPQGGAADGCQGSCGN